jgi:esterase/lipase superfamily enzyme
LKAVKLHVDSGAGGQHGFAIMLSRVAVPWIAGLMLLPGCASFNPARHDTIYQEAFFLTTREDSGQENPAERFNGLRGQPAYGVAMLAIDPESALSSFSVPQPNRILQQEQLLQRDALQQLEPISEEAFFRFLGQYGEQGGPPDEVLIFIHGYKRSFGNSVENAANLRYQLAFKGPVIAFSWPSTDSVTGYLADVENLEWSAPVLSQLINRLSRELPGTRLNILAHSLGSRGLLRVLSELSATGTGPGDCAIGDVIFFAPDFDREIFIRDLAPALVDMPFRMTLYVSSEDFPLIASGAIFQYPRLGDSREGPPIIKGVETIDVSDAINYFDGHGYYESNRATIEDLYHLIHEGKRASMRPGLIEVKTPDGSYWRLQVDR